MAMLITVLVACRVYLPIIPELTLTLHILGVGGGASEAPIPGFSCAIHCQTIGDSELKLTDF